MHGGILKSRFDYSVLTAAQREENGPIENPDGKVLARTQPLERQAKVAARSNMFLASWHVLPGVGGRGVP
jgi:hypothetical protein